MLWGYLGWTVNLDWQASPFKEVYKSTGEFVLWDGTECPDAGYLRT